MQTSSASAKPAFDSKSTYEQIMKQLEEGPGADDPSGATVEKRKVTFWKNGFQLDDGDFRPNTDPANQAFLADISRGQIPRELHKRGVEIDLEIDDKREDDYKPKPKPLDPWAGGGRTVGGAAPARPPPRAAPSAAAPPIGETNFGDGTPTTKVQLLFATGPKVTLTVPLRATIGELRGFATRARPDLEYRHLLFSCQFPDKELSNDEETIEGAGLKMAQIKVKLG
jgi:UBX domain-containing protein 1